MRKAAPAPTATSGARHRRHTPPPRPGPPGYRLPPARQRALLAKILQAARAKPGWRVPKER